MADTDMSAATATGKRNSVADVDYDEETGAMSITFVDGRILQANVSQFPEGVCRIATLRGFTEAWRDTYAGVKGDVDKAYNLANGRMQAMLAGDWGKRREGEGGGVGALWIEAFADLKKWYREDGTPDVQRARLAVKEKIDSGPEGEALVEALKKSDPIKAKVAEIRAKRAQEALLAAQKAAAESGAASQAALDAF